MTGLQGFRFEVWTDGHSDMCCFRADMPKSEGLKHLWFVMTANELRDIASGRSFAAVDGYHHLSVMGDLWSVYDLELDTRTTSGILPVKFYNFDMPNFFVRMLARAAKRTWKLMRAIGATHGEKKTFEFSPSYMTRILRLYGQGKGKVNVIVQNWRDDERAEVEAWIAARRLVDPLFSERMDRLEQIARNSTRAFFQKAYLYLSKVRNEEYFDWSAHRPNGTTILNGGLVLHKDGDWGIHT